MLQFQPDLSGSIKQSTLRGKCSNTIHTIGLWESSFTYSLGRVYRPL